MKSVRLGHHRFSLGTILFILFSLAAPIQVSPAPSDPSEPTEEYALLLSNPDGSIQGVKAKVKLFDPGSPGPGELRAHLHYEAATAPGEWGLKYTVSEAVPVEGVTSGAASSTGFDFGENPVPGEANPVGLKIYHRKSSLDLLMLIAEYGQDRLLMEGKGVSVQTPPPPEGSVLIWGPVSFVREQGKPIMEQLSFPVPDAAGPFLLRLTNGTAEGTRRVSSAAIKLNGREVFRPSELNQQVSELRHQVVLMPGENLIEATLRSAPGSLATLELFRLEKQACAVYDSRTFRRYKGKPIKEVDVFNLNPQFTAPYVLNLTSGNPDGSQRADSALIALNEVQVFEPSEFNEQVGGLSRSVLLQPLNTLSVELRGAPGDFLSIGITGYDNTPPQVTITSPANGEVFNASPITVSGIVDDPSAALTINGIPAPVGEDGIFFLDGLMIAAGENEIKAVAVDTCGNQGKDQVSVNLQSTQEGPLLSLCIGSSMPTIAARAADCRTEAFTRGFGMIRGTTERTATELIIDGISLPREEWIEGKGNMDWGMWDGTYFTALLDIPGPDGVYPIMAVAKNEAGGTSEATVTFIKDTAGPKITIISPRDGWVTNNPGFTLTGTVDDPQATLYGGWDYSPIPIADGAFTAEGFLYEEGPNYVSITGFDPAWNASETVIWVTLDTISPQLKIANLTDGMAVSNPVLKIAGTMIDETPGAVTAAVNGGPAETLALAERDFSGAVSLFPGLNTLAIIASDRTGNTSQLIYSVFLDMEPPSVAIVSPSPGANVSGMISVAVNAGDAGAGVASVSLLVDGLSRGTLTRSPFTFPLDTATLGMGRHTITAVGTDNAGNRAEANIMISVSNLMVEIVSPADGATVNKSRAIVRGIIHNQTGEIGVVVNGVLAEVNGNEFAVVVPLQLGQNILTATVKTAGGVQIQTSVTVNTDLQQENIRLTVYPVNGILKLPLNSLNVAFEAEAYLPNPVASYSWDFDGNGAPEIAGAEPRVAGQYQSPGLYFPRLTVTDVQGATFAESIPVNVLSGEEIDSLLKSKWEAVRNCLSNQDIDGALVFFNDPKKGAYRKLFNALASQLTNIVHEMANIQMIEYMGTAAIYDLRTFRKGEEYSFHLCFEKDFHGIWKISSF